MFGISLFVLTAIHHCSVLGRYQVFRKTETCFFLKLVDHSVKMYLPNIQEEVIGVILLSILFPSVVIAKEAFNRKISLLTSKLNIELRKKLVRCYVWSIGEWRR